VFSGLIELTPSGYPGDVPVFVHRNLLFERSLCAQLIDESSIGKNGQPTVELPGTSYDACAMLAQWLYGQPLCEDNDDPEDDLAHLADIYNVACVADKYYGVRDSELIDACLDAIGKCLAQKDKVLHDPISNLEYVLTQNDKYGGSAFVLRQLVYGECGTDGRTKAWLEGYCDGSGNSDEEAVILICKEFAKKACELSQNSGGNNSTRNAD